MTSTMNITKDTVVTLRYKVANAQGQLLEESKDPMVYLHGGYDNTFPKIEAALDGQAPGFSTTVVLEPADAFGERDESLATTIPRTQFPAGVKVGGSLRGASDDGQERIFRVIKIKGPVVLLDANHPLAGQTLKFSMTVAGVRPATEEEITHRHVHGEHGHHH
jgi:FKBP-type peptidyl-prolyl cis-trans isomerase SlyD